MTVINSILDSVKAYCNIDTSDTSFDSVLLILINGNFFILTQYGVGEENYQITGSSEVWSDFVDVKKYSAVQPWMCLKAKLAFDPSSNTTILNAQQKLFEEYDWRLREQVSLNETEVESDAP